MANIFRIDRVTGKVEFHTHTASKILALDASKDLEVVTIGSSLDYSRPTLDTIQDIRTSASPQLAGIELGHASDTTLTRVSAGVVAIEGTNIAMSGGAFHDGFSDFVANEHIDHTSVTLTAGTGLTGGGDISTNRTFAVDGLLEDLDTLGANNGDSEFIVGTGAGALAWESGATARTSIGLGTVDTPQFAKLGINTAAPANGLLGIVNTAINTTASYYGTGNLHVKTAGATDYNDVFIGFDNDIVYNQSGGVLGNAIAFFNILNLTDGDVGDASNPRNFRAIYNLADLNGGKVYGNAYGLYTNIDQEAGNEVAIDIYGHYITIDADGTVGGSVYGLYILEGSNVDYGIYQNGSANNYLGGSLGIGIAPVTPLTVEGILTLPKASGNGIKIDTTTPTFGWRDLLGQPTALNTGASKPTFTAYRDTLLQFQFAAGDEEYFEFHIPHDYVAGTDIHLHIHWSHIGTFVTGGTVTFEYEISYAKGHNQAAFPASVGTTFNGTASTTQYQQIITEVQISAASPDGNQIDSDDLEPDGIIIARFELNSNDITVSEAAVPDPFIHYVDIHYQSTNIATKDKVPDFYT